MVETIPGLELAHRFYHDVLIGIVGAIPHAAAMLGEGSEVLGFDTERSTDHAWGPRAQIFVEPDAVGSLRSRITAELPDTFRGWPVRYFRWQTGHVEHHVEVTTLSAWLQSHLGIDPRPTMTTSAWLAMPQQLLLEATCGRVFRDDTGELTRVREMLAWYPRDVWMWTMASQWHRLGDMESFIGRTAELGDDLGSRLVTARIAQDAVRLCFLQERQYTPYAKWLGTAFARLGAAAEIGSMVKDALAVADFAEREATLMRLYEALAHRHNALGVTPPLSTATGLFEVGINDAVRPFPVLHADRFARACRESIADKALRRLPMVGSVDQLTSPTDLMIHFTDWPRQLSEAYRHQLNPHLAVPDPGPQ